MTFEEAMSRIAGLVREEDCGDAGCDNCKRCREALEVVKEEGDSRAEEMRERCAVVASRFGSPSTADEIQALPLTEAKGNG